MVASLLPKNFKGTPATLDDIKLVSIIWGITIGVVIFTAWKAIDQTIPMLRRGRLFYSSYLWMVWIHLITNSVASTLGWLFMDGVIPMGFPILFVFLFNWVFQVQLPLQIIINRTALMMPNKRIANRLRWGVAIFIGLINISVFCIWIPARLQISERYIAINRVWDRIEKVLFAVVDLGLNMYFLYIVKSQLIECGLVKYKTLFKFNVCMVVVSISMDILLITLMDLSTPYCYLQFHPLAYLVKLHIEVVMTELIIKIVRYSNRTRTNTSGTTQQDTHSEYIKEATLARSETRKKACTTFSSIGYADTYNASVSAKKAQWNVDDGVYPLGIEKTVECEIEAQAKDGDIDEGIYGRDLEPV